MPTKVIALISPRIKLLRPHQWAKNLLIFLPALLAHRLHEQQILTSSALAFLAFSLIASSTYIINDVLDRHDDRSHTKKRHRPIASGTVSVPEALALSLLSAAASMTIAFNLSVSFRGVLLMYGASTLLYSLFCKRLPMLDVTVLAGLYALRVVAGSHASSVAFSEWLLLFSIFFFFGLACIKRGSELIFKGQGSGMSSRGYRAEDGVAVNQIGMAASMISTLVFALYIRSPEVQLLYSEPRLLWFLCPLLIYWQARLWLLSSRGTVEGDPLVFALSDRTSYAVGAAILALILRAV